jgi:HAD superfamily hydrolase (TIGR01549 family)
MDGATKVLKRHITTALFDLGGTLMHDDPAAWNTVYRRAEKALWETLQKDDARITPGALYAAKPSLLEYYYELRAGLDEPGIERVLRDLLTRAGAHVRGPTIRRALDAMFAVTQGNWHPEEDAFSTLESLRQARIRLGVVSNGSDDANAHRLLDRAGLAPFFQLILTSAAFGRRKPDPTIFEAALTHLDARPGEAVMVGDNLEADILGAAGVGMNTIWIVRRVSTGQRVQRAPGATATVMSLREVSSMLA